REDGPHPVAGEFTLDDHEGAQEHRGKGEGDVDRQGQDEEGPEPGLAAPGAADQAPGPGRWRRGGRRRLETPAEQETRRRQDDHGVDPEQEGRLYRVEEAADGRADRHTEVDGQTVGRERDLADRLVAILY